MHKISKNSENIFVVLSSFINSFLGIILFIKQVNPILASTFFVVGIIAFFHHVYPNNQIIRFFDWSFSLSIFLYVLLLYKITPVFYLPIIILFLMWLLSFYSFHKLHNIWLYNLTHTFWHIFGAIFVYFLIFSFNL